MGTKPQPTDVKIGSSALFIPNPCGKCRHFRRVAHPAYEKVCETLGVLREQKPCERFSPDAGQLKFSDRRHANLATDMLRSMSKSDLSMLASLAMQERRTREAGYNFGDTVYVQRYGGDYLDNYDRCKVISADGKHVQIVADAGHTGMYLHASVLTATQWRRKEKWLINNERLRDPNRHRYNKIRTPAEIRAEKARTLADIEAASGDFVQTNVGEPRRSVRATPLDQLLVERPMPVVKRMAPLPTRLRVQ